jgi:peptide-methionine (S)-S-oxide reductase
MIRSLRPVLFAAGVGVLLFGLFAGNAFSGATALPKPAVDEQQTANKGSETVVFAGGCFWGIQAVFEHIKGVTKTTAGFSGGNAKSPSYEDVSSGETGHAESVEVVYDPSQVTFGQLLQVFFSVAHDPTELNRQGPDEGTQYRSAIFYETPDQQHIAQAYVDQLMQAKAFSHSIVTQILPFKAFYRAEDYHQDFALHNPGNMYIMINDAPKVSNLKKQFPDLYANYPR